ncbi:MAG: exopolysaccharide biosynthesis polyprenyl glycosylphosphotransferase [Acetobacter sp.]
MKLTPRAKYLSRRKVLVLGGAPDGENIARELLRRPDRYNVIGIFDDRWERLEEQGVTHSAPMLGSVDDMITLCREDLPDMIVIAIFDAGRERLRNIVRKVIVLPVDIYLATDIFPPGFSNGALQDDGLDICLLPISKAPLSGGWFWVKWVEDKIFSLLFIAAFLPLYALIALLIKIDSRGPVFFVQNRYGFNDKVIKVLKFRTMYVDKGDPTGAGRTVRNDPRVTRIGRYLRNFSLDELPQFFNVLRGEMSVVGPRAHATAMRVDNELYEKAIDCYSARHRVRPGMTGLAQVRGYRGEITSREAAQKRVDCDLYYITHWSLGLDLKIILKSIGIVLFSRENAF